MKIPKCDGCPRVQPGDKAVYHCPDCAGDKPTNPNIIDAMVMAWRATAPPADGIPAGAHQPDDMGE